MTPEALPMLMRWPYPRARNGFSLIELMLSLSLGSVLFLLLIQWIGVDLQLGSTMATRLRESALQRRTLELIRDELALGSDWSVDPQPSMGWPCAMAGRRPVLAISLEPSSESIALNSIIYSVGPAPSPIWRGQVLMRCGPAYGLDGAVRAGGKALNRVLVDGLPQDDSGFRARLDPRTQVLHLQLEQLVAGGPGRVRSNAVF